jgi:hypothetical protein
MPRVIVTTDPANLPNHVSVLLDEQVHTVHLSSGHAAAQLVERIAWAISDAEATESGPSTPAAEQRASARRTPRTRPRAVSARAEPLAARA